MTDHRRNPSVGHRALAWAAAIVPLVTAPAWGGNRPDILWMGGGHSQPCSSSGVSPDGSLWLSGGHFIDSTVKVWNAADGRLLRTFRGGFDDLIFGGFQPVHTSADNRYVLSIGEASTVALWSMETGDLLWKINSLTYDAAFSVDQTQIVTGHGDGRIRWWRVSDGALLTTWVDSQPLRSIAPSPNGTILVSGGDGNVAHIWSIAEGRILHTLTGQTNSVFSVAVTPDSQIVATGAGDGTVRLWRAADGQLLRTLTAPFSFVFHVGFSPDGTLVQASGFGSDVAIWDVQTGAPVQVISGTFAAWAEFTRGGTAILTAGQDGHVRVWDVNTGALRQSLTHHTLTVAALAFAPTGAWLASASYDWTVRLWNTVDGSTRGDPLMHGGIVMAVAVSPDGSLVATGSGDKMARLWNAADGSLVRVWQPHTWSVDAVAFSPDGAALATADASTGNIKLWDVGTGAQRWSASGHSGGTTSLAFADAGDLLVSGGQDRSLKVWLASNGALQRTLTGHVAAVNAVAVAPNGRTAATAGADEIVNVWDILSGANLHTLSGHTQAVRGVSFSADSQVLASTSRDWTVRFWRVSDGEPLQTYDEEMGGLDGNASVVFSPDGRLFVYGREDATLVVARNPFAPEGVPCEDIRRLAARCRRNVLKVTVRMTDASHDGQALGLDINGEAHAVTLEGDTGKLRLRDRFGPFTVVVTDPPDCGLERSVDCG